MKVVAQADETVLKIIKNFKKAEPQNRMLHYCVETVVEDGILLFNLLTREMVLLSQQEYDARLESAYLKDHWFVVPENTNERAYADFVRSFLDRQKKQDSAITQYTIFPTTDCNARCFYCFELGRSRIPMSQETAWKVSQYIKAHCGGKRVHLTWFGGEPLYNSEAIDTICEGLQQEGVEYSSFVVSNGYLFDEAMVRKAVDAWKLKRVQITLDGTEKVYNKIKAFIYREGNPYLTVLENIEKLLDASVQVVIRLNMDLSNAEDLMMLVEELVQRFSGRDNIYIYAHHLFKNDQALAETYSKEEWIQRENAMIRLEEKIKEGKMAPRAGISKHIRRNHCIADSDRSVTILPDGKIGRCEHYSETEIAGHIDREEMDQQVVNSWKERIQEIPECATCFRYPECFMLRKCPSQSICFLQHRQRKQRAIQGQMVRHYEHWLNETVTETTEDEYC